MHVLTHFKTNLTISTNFVMATAEYNVSLFYKFMSDTAYYNLKNISCNYHVYCISKVFRKI